MTRNPLVWIGLAGIDPDDNARALAWQTRLHWVMAGIPLVRVVRVAVAGLVMAQALVSFHVLFTRRGAPFLVGEAVAIMLSAGAMFYWLEPTVRTYWDGLWLAFVTGATIGYGDFVPTTGQSRILAVFTALVGVALVTLVTANVVTFFIGRDEEKLRREMQREIAALRADVAILREQLAHRDAGEWGEPPVAGIG